MGVVIDSNHEDKEESLKRLVGFLLIWGTIYVGLAAQTVLAQTEETAEWNGDTRNWGGKELRVLPGIPCGSVIQPTNSRNAV
jgi:hypothetical protein